MRSTMATGDSNMNTLATALGIAPATLNTNSTFILMTGANVDERAQSARDYLIANSAAWEPVTP